MLADEKSTVTRRAPAAMRHNDRHYRMTTHDSSSALQVWALQLTNVPMMAVGVDGLITDVNEAVLRHSGLPREHWVGRIFGSHFENPEAAQKLFDRTLATGHSVNQLVHVRTQHGQQVELDLTLTAFRGVNGQVQGLFVEARNVTGARAAELKLEAASRYARSLLEASLDPLVTISTEGKIMDVNRATELATGWPREALIGSDFSEYFTEPQRAREGYQQVFSQGSVMDYALVMRHRSGSIKEVLYNASVYRDEKGQVAGVFAAARDITALKRFQRELESTNREVVLLGEMTGLLQSCRTVQEALPIITLTMSQLFPEASGQLMLLNPATNWLEDAGTWGRHRHRLHSLPPSECWALRRGHVHEVGFGPSINPPCVQVKCKNKPYLCMPLLAQGSNLGIIQLVIDPLRADQARLTHARHLAATAADSVSLALANLQLRESLQAASIHDHLTGLYNRGYMEEALAREISRMERDHKPLTVAMLDLDHFKQFNDRYGHEAGDAVLRAFAQLLSGFREGSDLACRYGGEEFLLILPDLHPDKAVDRLDALRLAVAALRVEYQGKALPPLTVSVGLASAPHTPLTAANWSARRTRPCTWPRTKGATEW